MEATDYHLKKPTYADDSESTGDPTKYRHELDAYPIEVLQAVLKILKAQAAGKSLNKNDAENHCDSHQKYTSTDSKIGRNKPQN